MSSGRYYVSTYCVFIFGIIVGPFVCLFVFFLMIRRPPRSTLDRSSAASDVYKRQSLDDIANGDKKLLDTLENFYIPLRLELEKNKDDDSQIKICLLYTSPSPRDRTRSRMPSSA